MNTFNDGEFQKISSEFNTEPIQKEIVIEYSTSGFFGKVKKSVLSDRRGEVAFCVIRPNGKIITVTCEEYPKGIFRIPTGGIGHKEDIIEAVHREAKEELGLDTRIESFLGVLKIKFVYDNESVMFYSYLFVLKELGGRLLEDATDNEVSEVREVNLTELQEIADFLLAIEGKWNDWGRFRFETTNAFLKYFTDLD